MLVTFSAILSILLLKNVSCTYLFSLPWGGNYFMTVGVHQPDLSYSTAAGPVTSQQPPSPQDLFTPAINVFPVESAKQRENYDKALREIFEEDMTNYANPNDNSTNREQNFFSENSRTQQTYVSVKLGNYKYSYEYLV